MNVDNTGLFAGEQPAPITVNNNAGGKKGRQASANSRKRSTSAKKRGTSSSRPTYDRNQTNKYKKSIDKIQKKIGAKDKLSKPLDSNGGWNASTTTGKYFDVNVDARERRAAEARQKDHISEKAAKIIKASGAAIQVKTANEEPGKYNVEFQNRNGGISTAIQIYQNID